MGKKSGGAAGGLLTAIVIIIILLLLLNWLGFLNFGGVNLHHQPFPNGWIVTVSSTPLLAGSTTPSGRVGVQSGSTMNATATALSGYSFSKWIFDNVTLGAQPYIIIQAQAVNSTHSLLAVFVPSVPAFTISPPLITTVGSSFTFRPTLQNNLNSTISQVGIRLNDPNHIFTNFQVDSQLQVFMAGHNLWPLSCLNEVVQPIIFPDYSHMIPIINVFGSQVDSYPTCHSTVNPHSAAPLELIGSVSKTAPAGVYTLSFDLYYVASGTYTSAPITNIPWTVTIL
jgi:hypothetical protein